LVPQEYGGDPYRMEVIIYNVQEYHEFII